MKAVWGPSPLEIAMKFKAGWSLSRIVTESGLKRAMVKDILRLFVVPCGSQIIRNVQWHPPEKRPCGNKHVNAVDLWVCNRKRGHRGIHQTNGHVTDLILYWWRRNDKS
jgi:hypothetical protein